MSTDIRNSSSALDIPPLVAGDRLSRDEFERRYEAMPDVKKAELIEGVVYMPSPVRINEHGAPHAALVGWLFAYAARTPGLQVADNSTVRLDGDNEPQPDVILRTLPEYGGQSHQDGSYVGGGPEWVGEVTASTKSYDLFDKKEAYRRNNVREYLVWRVQDGAIDWFSLQGGEYIPIQSSSDGIYQSKVYPGLWLASQSLLKGDMAKVLQVVGAGVETPEHAKFVAALASARR